VRCKRPKKKKKNHLIFINFGVKKFTLKNTQKKKTFESHGMRSYNFWRLMFNKVTLRSYNYFLKFSYLFW
jgi:hypothetical protein